VQSPELCRQLAVELCVEEELQGCGVRDAQNGVRLRDAHAFDIQCQRRVLACHKRRHISFYAQRKQIRGPVDVAGNKSFYPLCV